MVGQWIRYRDWYAPALQLWFWQDRTGRDVDLLIEADQRLVPVECKWKERPVAGDAVGIRRLRALYGTRSQTASLPARRRAPSRWRRA